MRDVYFDYYGATTPVRPEVVEAMLPYLKEQFGNPLSLHRYGDGPRQAVEDAREKVAELIGARGDEIYFTASCSGANNMAVKGVALMNRVGGGLTATVLPRHRTYSSYPAASSIGVTSRTSR